MSKLSFDDPVKDFTGPSAFSPLIHYIQNESEFQNNTATNKQDTVEMSELSNLVCIFVLRVSIE
ncbi:MAG TPA: hypothetical protein DCY25_12130 [Bacteroidales bacterium]|nr:hypothetical protein [Bacteroidales bacterium]